MFLIIWVECIVVMFLIISVKCIIVICFWSYQLNALWSYVFTVYLDQSFLLSFGCLLVFCLWTYLIIIIIINLIYIVQFDTKGTHTALYIVITYIQLQYVCIWTYMKPSYSYTYTCLHIYIHRHMYKYIYRHTNNIAHTHITNLPTFLHLHVCIGIYTHA